MSLVDEIADYLVAASTVFTLFESTSGDLAKMIALDHDHAGDTMTVVYETPGSASEFAFSTSTGAATVVFDRPSFQILSRATTWTEAKDRADTAHSLLNGLTDRSLPTATGTRYLQIVGVQPPFYLQRDENDRYIVSSNYDAWRE